MTPTFDWLIYPRCDFPLDTRWYIDGSMFDRVHPLLRRTGYGILAIDRDNNIIAMGCGIAPRYVKDAAGAEAYAFYIVVQLSPFFPYVTTDCKGVLDTLHAGKDRATAATSTIARIWNAIFGVLDDCSGSGIDYKKLVWMPAHGAVHTIHNALKSNGRPITPIDWRANRLVDACAKHAVTRVRVDKRILVHIASAGLANEFSIAKLGTVTHAANHYSCTFTKEDGSYGHRVMRDSAATRPYYRNSQGPRKSKKSFAEPCDTEQPK